MGRLRLLVAGRRPVSGGRLALLALVVLAGATACQPGGMTPVTVPCAPASGTVGGCVTNSRAGGAAAGPPLTPSPGGTRTTAHARAPCPPPPSPRTFHTQ